MLERGERSVYDVQGRCLSLFVVVAVVEVVGGGGS